MSDVAPKTARWSPRALLERLGVIVLGLLLWEAAVRGFEVSPLLVLSPLRHSTSLRARRHHRRVLQARALHGCRDRDRIFPGLAVGIP